jgi:enoyl-CoA hydratase/carnithine racemase
VNDPVLRSDIDGVVTLTLNRPETRNPISDPAMIDALCGALAAADADPAARVVVLTGAGKAFSSGGDIATMRKGGGLNAEAPVETRNNYRRGIQRIPLLMESLEVPVIAAVNGPAIGAGCDLACMCDIRIAGESARFAESFVKMGIVPGDGGAWLLQRTIGYSRAAELTFTGELLGADEALACGLVSRVVPDAELIAAATDLARRIAANPPYAIRMSKRLMREARTASLAAILEMSAAFQALAHETDDNAEAVSAFLEKRPPQFTGR